MVRSDAAFKPFNFCVSASLSCVDVPEKLLKVVAAIRKRTATGADSSVSRIKPSATSRDSFAAKLAPAETCGIKDRKSVV